MQLCGFHCINKYQMGSNINILYHSYQESLKYQLFIAFQYIFHTFVYFGKFTIDW